MAAARRLPVVLGSESKWRRGLLRDAGLVFECCAADIDEKAVTAGFPDRKTADPTALTLAIANAKADALCNRFAETETLLITSDQVVVYEGCIREKPESEDVCRAYLASYQSAPAQTVTAVVVTNTRNGQRWSRVDVAQQHFKPIPREIVDQVIAKGDIMYCAGGFMIDEPLFEPYLGERIGSESSIIGMPLEVTMALLEQAQLASQE
eukprot:m.5426 g.5426  ORF g.5426 m.5426 type:complete len:208 (-) comp2512_c0_seq2:165-788(-)